MAKPEPQSAALPAEPVALGRGAGRVPLGTVLSYAPPVAALSATLFFVQFFFINYATDVLLIAPIVVSVIFAAGRLWDAVTDPIVGTWSDRTRTRLGRRRPWMLVAIPLLAVFSYAVWVPPRALEGAALIVWVTVALFGFYAAFTCYAVPHQSLGAELTSDYHDRSRIFGAFNAFFTLGMIFAFAGMQYVITAADSRDAARTLVLLALLVVLPVLAIPPARLRERPDYQGRGAESPFRALRDVLRNHYARRVLGAQFVQLLGIAVVGLLSPYYLKYVLKRPDLIGPLPAAFILCSVASIPLWVLASRRFGKRATWMTGMLVSGVAFAGTAFVTENDVSTMAVFLVIAGIATAAGGTIGPSVLADVIDADEYETGERKEGAYSAAWGFVIKAANAFMILVTGAILQLVGFEPNVEQSDLTKLALRGLYAVLPLLGFTLGALVLSGYRLDEVEHARIRQAIDERGQG